MGRLALELIEKVTELLSKSPGLVDVIGLATYLVNEMKDNPAFTDDERARVLKVLRREIDNSIPENSGVTPDEVIDVAIRANSRKGLQRLLAEDVEETAKAMKRRGRVSATDVESLSPVLGGHRDFVEIEKFNDALETIKGSVKSRATAKDSPTIIKFYVDEAISDSKFSDAVAKHWLAELKKIKGKLSSKPDHPALQAIDEAIKSIEGHVRKRASGVVGKAAESTQSIKSYEQSLRKIRDLVQDSYGKFASALRRHHTSRKVENIKRVIDGLESVDDPKKLEEFVVRRIKEPTEDEGKKTVTVTGGDEMAKRKAYVNVQQRIRGGVNTLLTSQKDTHVINFKNGHAIVLKRTGDTVEVNYNFKGKRYGGKSFNVSAGASSGVDVVDDIARKVGDDYAATLKIAQEKGVFAQSPTTQQASTVKVGKKQQKTSQSATTQKPATSGSSKPTAVPVGESKGSSATVQTAAKPKLIPESDVGKIASEIAKIHESPNVVEVRIPVNDGRSTVRLAAQRGGSGLFNVAVSYYAKGPDGKDVLIGLSDFVPGSKSDAETVAKKIADRGNEILAKRAQQLKMQSTGGTAPATTKEGGATVASKPEPVAGGTKGGATVRVPQPATSGSQQQGEGLAEIKKGIEFLKNNPTAESYNAKLAKGFGLKIFPVRDEQGNLKSVKTVTYILRGDEYVAIPDDTKYPVRNTKKTPESIYEKARISFKQRDELFEQAKQQGRVEKLTTAAVAKEQPVQTPAEKTQPKVAQQPTETKTAVSGEPATVKPAKQQKRLVTELPSGEEAEIAVPQKGSVTVPTGSAGAAVQVPVRKRVKTRLLGLSNPPIERLDLLSEYQYSGARAFQKAPGNIMQRIDTASKTAPEKTAQLKALLERFKSLSKDVTEPATTSTVYQATAPVPEGAPRGAVTSIDVLPSRGQTTQQIAMEQVPSGVVKRTVASVGPQTKVPTQKAGGRIAVRTPDGTVLYGTRDDIKAVLGAGLRKAASGTIGPTARMPATNISPTVSQPTVPVQSTAREAAAIEAAARQLPVSGGAAAGELAAGEAMATRLPKVLQTMKGKAGPWLPWAVAAAFAAPYLINWIRGSGHQEQAPILPQMPQMPPPPQMVMPPNVAPSPADMFNALMLRQIMEDDLRRTLSGYGPAGLMPMPMGGGMQAMPMVPAAPMTPTAPVMTQ